MQVNRKGIEIRERFLLEFALNIHEKGFSIPKIISDHIRLQKVKNPRYFVSPSFQFGAKKLVASVRYDATRS